MGKAPYFALFSSKAQVGSKHDIKLFQENIPVYEKYLASGSQQGTYWDLVADKGYISESLNTKFKVITPKKKNMAGHSPLENEKISKYIKSLIFVFEITHFS